ncbi:MAG TPA: DUF4381 family protein [Steroidobacteraceae bacterium]|jgi:hypothetical protein|nr:DUF4381 family protein [Steroidobacteraceae bacterium]
MRAGTTIAAGVSALGARLGLLLASSVSFAAPAAEDIRDIRGPKPVASPWLVWGLVAGGVLAALAAYAFWRRTRRRRGVPPRPDFEVALERLEAARLLMQPGRGREFSIEVSGIVREYIEKRFSVMAAHRTTHEFLHDLMASGESGLADHRDLLGEFLQSCDLAKFGGWNLSTDQMAIMLESARRFIRSAAGTSAAGTLPANLEPPNVVSKPHVSVPST